MTSQPDQVSSLAQTVGRNVARLRGELRWSQQDLADALSASTSGWTRQTIGMLETQGVRADRLEDLSELCEALGASLEELLAGEQVVRLRSGGEVPLRRMRKSLLEDGKPSNLATAEAKALVRGIGEDDGYENARIASALAVSEDQLQRTVRDFTGHPSATAAQLRDYRARLEPAMTRSEARARRGHATRLLKRELIDGEPIESFDPVDFARWLKEHGTALRVSKKRGGSGA